MKKILLFILFVIIALILYRGLSLHPEMIPSPLINKSAPSFSLPSLTDSSKKVSNKDFLGNVTLVNVWASWCQACRMEHPLLLQIANYSKVKLVGLNYKDATEDATRWLNENGNPYWLVAVDSNGMVSIDWGIYGTPEAFLIDKKGIIRYKHIGVITEAEWEKDIKPRVDELWRE